MSSHVFACPPCTIMFSNGIDACHISPPSNRSMERMVTSFYTKIRQHRQSLACRYFSMVQTQLTLPSHSFPASTFQLWLPPLHYSRDGRTHAHSLRNMYPYPTQLSVHQSASRHQTLISNQFSLPCDQPMSSTCQNSWCIVYVIQ
jgi:hypothetical protein